VSGESRWDKFRVGGQLMLIERLIAGYATLLLIDVASTVVVTTCSQSIPG